MLLSRLKTWWTKEEGGMTAYGLFASVAVMAAGGYAIDFGNAINQRTLLQMTADSAAHAALVTRELGTDSEAINAALTVASKNMPVSSFGQVLEAEDVVFGDWDRNTRTFTPSATSRTAVKVTARQSAENANSVSTYLLKLVGIDKWNLSATAVYTTYYPTCFREGFVSSGPVDIQSNNSFRNGFCIHSNDYVSLNQNNYFEPGTIVSMPDLDEIDLPASGFTKNIGLSAALREGSYNIRIISRIDDIIATVDEPSSKYYPSYVNQSPKTTTKTRIGAADLKANAVNYWNCGSRGSVDSNTLIKDVVIVASCAITFGSGTVIENSVIVTSSISSESFKASSGLQIGENDSCGEGGGAQLVTMGGMKFASNLQVYGSQLLAIGDIQFAAQANGIQGAAMVSASSVSGTSNMSMAFCGTGMSDNFEAEYFRMVD